MLAHTFQKLYFLGLPRVNRLSGCCKPVHVICSHTTEEDKGLEV